PQVAFINDPVAGVNYALNQKDRTATKSNWIPRGHGPRPGPPPDVAQGLPRRPHAAATQNIRTESLGRQTVEGIPADGTRTTITIPAGQMGNELPIQIVTERWYSPDLQTEV